MFHNLDSRIYRCKGEVSKVYSLTDLRSLSIKEIESKSRAIVDLWSLLRIKDFQLFQRSTSKLLKERDINFGYLLVSIKSGGRRNDILSLKVGDN